MNQSLNLSRVILLLMLLTSTAWAEPTDQTYVNPKLFDGAICINTAKEFSRRQAGLLDAILSAKPDRLIVVGTSQQREGSPSLEVLRSIKWTSEPSEHSSLLEHPDQLQQQIKDLKPGSCIWLSQAALPPESQAATPAWLPPALRSLLDRGGLVFVEATSIPAGNEIAADLNLLPDIRIRKLGDKGGQELAAPNDKPQDKLNADKPNADKPQKNYATLLAPDHSWLFIGSRELVNLSEEGTTPCRLVLPAPSNYPEALSEDILPRMRSDLVVVRRALEERQLPVFPSSADYDPRLPKGSLVIVGGGGMSQEIWKKFIELAGGENAKILVLPTAVPEPTVEDADEVDILNRLGVKQVRVLPQVARDDVSKPEYLENYRWATGIWFGGGRQWRFVDAYWGTPAWQEIKQVVARGGVIAGSSAGATIQGDLLVRGHPLGNQIMVADGYRRGLGLLPGVAIDQHFSQRNRFDDLASVVKRFPKVIGIGIDEATALVVQAPNQCSVLGKGSVWLTLPVSGDAQRMYLEKATGSQFELTR
ncbi:MAG: cyanophycinase [Pirellulaceae bacterium]|nr:cyanophycinase [Pirellulaceae bacterium]